ncbi:MAG: regulator, partial [Oxalobacteraceae bacterium]
MWVGTRSGIVRFHPDGTHTLRFSRRWLMNDNVTSISFDASGTAWIGTENGVSAIRNKKMTLESKSDYFYDVLMRRHIRAPWIAGQCRLTVPGDTTTWKPDDDDNDGEYTGNYLVMESFRYATTKNNEAKINAKKAFGFLKFLQDVTGSKGYF